MRKKIGRNKGLVKMHRVWPNLSYSDLGFAFGISKQRVHRILQDNPEKLYNQREGILSHFYRVLYCRLKMWVCYPKVTSDTKNKGG